MNLILKRTRSLNGEIRVGSDKSITHRGIILGAIGEGKTVLNCYSRCADCLTTSNNFRKLGIEIKETGSAISIEGRGLDGLREPYDILDCENSGTTIRLLAGLLAGQKFFSVLTGDSSLRRRPMKRVIEPLTQMGAEIYGRDGSQFAPLVIRGRKLQAIDYKLPVASAQVKSAILLAGLYAEGETIVEEPGNLRDHTERMLDFFDVKVKRKDQKMAIEGRCRPKGREIFVPGDISSAAYFIVFASLCPESEILLKGIGVNPTRTGIFDVMKMMGAEISFLNEQAVSNEPTADLLVKHSVLKATEISGTLVPRLIDELPIIAVAATQARGTTVVKDAKELRVKETDRIKAIVRELKKMGGKIEEREDGFIVEGPTRTSRYGLQYL